MAKLTKMWLHFVPKNSKRFKFPTVKLQKKVNFRLSTSDREMLVDLKQFLNNLKEGFLRKQCVPQSTVYISINLIASLKLFEFGLTETIESISNLIAKKSELT